MIQTIEEEVRPAPRLRARAGEALARGIELTSKALRRFWVELCILAATACYANVILPWLWSDFVRGAFHFHDLTLITDFFTNALWHGKPFWITDYAINHLSIHFTPSLTVLIPAFLFFKSQFALLAIIAITICLGIAIATREHFESLTQAGAPLYIRIILAASFFVLLGWNRYTLRILQSAHFEPLYFLMAVLVLVAIRRGAKLGWTLAACVLAQGVRQDAGLFLFFLLISCLLAPESWPRIHRLRTCLAAGSCVLYVLLVTKVFLPFFGSNVSTREWSRWGATWPEVFLAWGQNPELVLEALRRSEFLAFNSEFSWLQTINGVVWMLNQLPSLLFYTAGTWDKQLLIYYNASFVLPGMLLCLAFSQLYALAFIRRMTRSWPVLRHTLALLLAAVFGYTAVHVAFYAKPDDDHVLVIESLERSDVFTNKELRRLLRCGDVHSVAADFNAIVYVPLRFDKYLLHNAKNADVVVQLHRDKRKLPFSPPPTELEQELTKQLSYRKMFRADGYDVFLSPNAKCM